MFSVYYSLLSHLLHSSRSFLKRYTTHKIPTQKNRATTSTTTSEGTTVATTTQPQEPEPEHTAININVNHDNNRNTSNEEQQPQSNKEDNTSTIIRFSQGEVQIMGMPQSAVFFGILLILTFAVCLTTASTQLHEKSTIVQATSEGAKTVQAGDEGGRKKQQGQEESHEAQQVAVTLPPLGFAEDALEPHMSKTTVHRHYHNHQFGYVRKLNGALTSQPEAAAAARAATSSAPMSLVTALAATLPPGPAANLAGQIFNHAMFFAGMKKDKPFSALPAEHAFVRAVNEQYGGVDALWEALRTEALSHFGSGWVFLLHNRTERCLGKKCHDVGSGIVGKLEVISTHDAGTPPLMPKAHQPKFDEEAVVIPLLAIDVWEHAYLYDYQHRRDTYLENFAQIINWEFVAERYLSGTVELGANENYPRFA